MKLFPLKSGSLFTQCHSGDAVTVVTLGLHSLAGNMVSFQIKGRFSSPC